MKKVKMGALKTKEKENALNEVRILASIDHPNIVEYKEVFIDEPTNCLCIVMEYAENGDLLNKIQQYQKSGAQFTERELWNMMGQLIHGLKALHDMKILHRDIKSANIFLCSNGVAKLGDLNVSKVAKRGLVYTQTGTPYYACPEVWKDKPYDLKSDIWSLGCVIYEAATKNPPFKANDMQGLYRKVVAGRYTPLPSQYSGDMTQAIAAMLQVEPVIRPNCDKLLALPCITKNINTGVKKPHSQSAGSLLQTIKIPRNFAALSKDLPESNYAGDRQRRRDMSVPAESRQTLEVPKFNKEYPQQKQSTRSASENPPIRSLPGSTRALASNRKELVSNMYLKPIRKANQLPHYPQKVQQSRMVQNPLQQRNQNVPHYAAPNIASHNKRDCLGTKASGIRGSYDMSTPYGNQSRVGSNATPLPRWWG